MRNFRTNTVAAGTDIDRSCAAEGRAIRTNRVVNGTRPQAKRQANKGKKRAARPEPRWTVSNAKPPRRVAGKGLAAYIADRAA